MAVVAALDVVSPGVVGVGGVADLDGVVGEIGVIEVALGALVVVELMGLSVADEPPSAGFNVFVVMDPLIPPVIWDEFEVTCP